MKRILVFLLSLFLLVGCSDGFIKVKVNPKAQSEMKAVWVSYLDFDAILRGKSEEEYTANVKTMLNDLESLGINRIYAHASAFTDAFYESSIYPWSKSCSGTLGKNPGFDPFKILVTEADYRNIAVEAWINPLRSYTEEEVNALPSSNIIKTWINDSWMREEAIMYTDGRYYLNPGSDKVVDLILSVAKELLDNYSISGIHIDDYFYPTSMGPEMDQLTYDLYVEENGEISREDYRLGRTDYLVKSLYDLVHQYDKKIFSISPNANIDTNYNTYFADVMKWTSERGYCDVMIPQVYFGFENDYQPFETVADRWQDLANGRVKLMYGLAAYKVGAYDEWAGSGANEWIENVDVLSRQVEYIKELEHYDGVAFFRYGSMFLPDQSILEQMKIELTKLQGVLH